MFSFKDKFQLLLKIMTSYNTQNQLLLDTLLRYYDNERLDSILPIINGTSKLSIRIIDWFVTNYSKKYYSTYNVKKNDSLYRFKVYNDYKLKLKAYSKKRFDPFCRWERINIPYKDKYVQTTIGQLNFFKWAIENNIVDYIRENFEHIEQDMNSRNSSAKKKIIDKEKINLNNNTIRSRTRKKREELSISAVKSVKKEDVEIVVKFD